MLPRCPPRFRPEVHIHFLYVRRCGAKMCFQAMSELRRCCWGCGSEVGLCLRGGDPDRAAYRATGSSCLTDVEEAAGSGERTEDKSFTAATAIRTAPADEVAADAESTGAAAKLGGVCAAISCSGLRRPFVKINETSCITLISPCSETKGMAAKEGRDAVTVRSKINRPVKSSSSTTSRHCCTTPWLPV